MELKNLLNLENIGEVGEPNLYEYLIDKGWALSKGIHRNSIKQPEKDILDLLNQFKIVAYSHMNYTYHVTDDGHKFFLKALALDIKQ